MSYSSPKNWFANIAFMLLALMFTANASANTGARATIHSSAKLTYNGGSAYASATVKVKLVAAAVDISVNETTGAAETGDNISFTYTFAANANGKDSYVLTADNQDEGVDTPTISFAGGNIVELGASIVSAPLDTPNVLKIPAGTADMFDDNDIVRLSDGSGTYPGTYRVISRIEGSVATTNTDGNTIAESPAQIVLETVTGSDLTSVPAGVQIGELKDVVVTITAGTLNGGATEAKHTINLSVSSQTDSSAKAVTSTGDNNEVVVNVNAPANVTFVKQVKLAGEADAMYATYKEAEPGVTLTYRITVTNGSTSTATGANVVDVIPGFTTYVADSITLNGDAYQGQLPWSVDGMSVKSSSATDDGDILAGETAVVTYQVIIN